MPLLLGHFIIAIILCVIYFSGFVGNRLYYIAIHLANGFIQSNLQYLNKALITLQIRATCTVFSSSSVFPLHRRKCVV